MIQGRASDISQDLMASLRDTKGTPEEKEEQIRRSVVESMRKEKTEEERKQERKKLAERREAYQDAHKKTLLAFANQPHTKIKKIFEHGSPERDGNGLFDGLYTRKNETIAMSTFNPGIPDEYMNQFLVKALAEIKSGKIAALVIVLFTDDKNGASSESINSILGLVPVDISERVNVVTTGYENAEAAIKSVGIDIKPAVTVAPPVDDAEIAE